MTPQFPLLLNLPQTLGLVQCYLPLWVLSKFLLAKWLPPFHWNFQVVVGLQTSEMS